MNLLLRANGDAAWAGWPSSPELEALRAQWLDAPGPASQQALARQIQARAFEDLPYIPLGQFFQPTAYRRAFGGVLKGPTVFWNIRRNQEAGGREHPPHPQPSL